jgi:hypothetical protein
MRRSRCLTPRRERPADLGEASQQRHQADARDSAAGEGTREDVLECRQGLGKEIPIPEAGPRRDDQDQTGLQEVNGEQQTGGKRNNQPPASTRVSRSTRSATSR